MDQIWKHQAKEMLWQKSALLPWQKKICRPAGVSCGSCLFVVVLSVLSLSRLSPWRRFLPRLTWTALLRFVLIFPYVVVGSTLPTSRSTPAWFCTSCCHFDGCFRFLLCLRSVCSVASHIQCLIHWLLCRTPFTRITLLNMAFLKAVLNMAFSKTLVSTHVLVQT